MNILKKLTRLASAPATLQAQAGQKLRAVITAEIPVPIHGLSVNVLYSGGIAFNGEVDRGNLFSGDSELAFNKWPEERRFYYQETRPLGADPAPAGSYVIATAIFTVQEAGPVKVWIENIMGTAYATGGGIDAFPGSGTDAEAVIAFEQAGGHIVYSVELQLV